MQNYRDYTGTCSWSTESSRYLSTGLLDACPNDAFQVNQRHHELFAANNNLFERHSLTSRYNFLAVDKLEGHNLTIDDDEDIAK